MRIHIIKVLKYTNSILARFSSGPFLPPLSPLLVFSTKSERVCSIEWDHRERGMDRCCSECRAPPPPTSPILPSCVLPSNLADAAKSKTFQTTPPSASACWRSVGKREGGIGESAGRRGLCLSWEGRRRRKDSPKKEGVSEGPNVFALHEMKAQSFCGTDKRGF